LSLQKIAPDTESQMKPAATASRVSWQIIVMGTDSESLLKIHSTRVIINV
jgi:hypothetical protein